jgi:hypothetical protein
MDETINEQDPAAFPPNTEGNGSQQESSEEEPSSATPITVEPSRNARDSRKKECTLPAQRLTRLIDEFMTGIAPEAHVAAGQPEPTEQKILASQPQQLSSTVEDITSNGLLRFILKKYLPYIDRLEELEMQSNEPSKDLDRRMQVLISVITLLQKNEAVQKLLDAQVQARTPIPGPQLSEQAQRMAKFSDVDRNLMREAGEKFKILLKRRVAEGRAELFC